MKKAKILTVCSIILIFFISGCSVIERIDEASQEQPASREPVLPTEWNDAMDKFFFGESESPSVESEYPYYDDPVVSDESFISGDPMDSFLPYDAGFGEMQFNPYQMGKEWTNPDGSGLTFDFVSYMQYLVDTLPELATAPIQDKIEHTYDSSPEGYIDPSNPGQYQHVVDIAYYTAELYMRLQDPTRHLTASGGSDIEILNAFPYHIYCREWSDGGYGYSINLIFEVHIPARANYSNQHGYFHASVILSPEEIEQFDSGAYFTNYDVPVAIYKKFYGLTDTVTGQRLSDIILE